MDAYVIHEDQKMIEAKPLNGKVFTFKEMYDYVGSNNIQLIETPSGNWMILDAEFKYTKVNVRASLILGQSARVYGKVLVCKHNMVK